MNNPENQDPVACPGPQAPEDGVRPEPKHRAAPLPTAYEAPVEQALDERHRERDTTADAYVADIVANAPSLESGRVIAQAYAKHGIAFALYLTLDGVDKYIRDYGPGHQQASPQTIESDFANSYHGRYPDRDALIDGVVETFGWQHDLDSLLHDKPDLRLAVTFDRDAIYEFANNHYEVLDGVNGLYVFERWP
jgi:hypothetical protein